MVALAADQRCLGLEMSCGLQQSSNSKLQSQPPGVRCVVVSVVQRRPVHSASYSSSGYAQGVHLVRKDQHGCARCVRGAAYLIGVFIICHDVQGSSGS
jgi:hypothetical protein